MTPADMDAPDPAVVVGHNLPTVENARDNLLEEIAWLLVDLSAPRRSTVELQKAARLFKNARAAAAEDARTEAGG